MRSLPVRSTRCLTLTVLEPETTEISQVWHRIINQQQTKVQNEPQVHRGGFLGKMKKCEDESAVSLCKYSTLNL